MGKEIVHIDDMIETLMERKRNGSKYVEFDSPEKRADGASIRWVQLSEKKVAYGRGYASFGEIMQGSLLGGRPFLVSLPVENSVVIKMELLQTDNGSCIQFGSLEKSAKAVKLLMQEIGHTHDVHIERVGSSIPIGKGWGSSSADMYAAAMALMNLTSTDIAPETLSKAFAEVEPHDPVMYTGVVAYDHINGKLIRDSRMTPIWHLLVIDIGGEVKTEEYHNHRPTYDAPKKTHYQQMYHTFQACRYSTDVANIATRAAKYHLENFAPNDPRLTMLGEPLKDLNAKGAVLCHSGTCLGYIFTDPISRATVARAEQMFPEYHVSVTRTR